MVTQVDVYENGKKRDFKIVCTAIAGLTVLEVVALLKGVNGTLFGIIVAAIAGMAGLVVPFDRVKEVINNATR